MLMRLLLAALRPSVEKLQLWVEEGSLNDHFDEMPICKGDDFSVKHGSVMSARYNQDVLRWEQHKEIKRDCLLRQVAAG